MTILRYAPTHNIMGRANKHVRIILFILYMYVILKLCYDVFTIWEKWGRYKFGLQSGKRVTTCHITRHKRKQL